MSFAGEPWVRFVVQQPESRKVAKEDAKLAKKMSYAARLLAVTGFVASALFRASPLPLVAARG